MIDHRGLIAPFRWEGAGLQPYKEEGTHFRGVSRQVLFDDPGADALGVQLRYFEVAPGGYTTLERHHHAHLCTVLRGAGRALVGAHVHPLAPHDVVHVPPDTWHQFRAGESEPLGFLCLVHCERDRPHRPTAEELEALRSDLTIAVFIRI